MSKDKILRIILLIRNVIFLALFIYITILGITTISSGYIEKAQELYRWSGLKIFLGFVVLIFGLVGTALSCVYLVLSIKALKNISCKAYTTTIIIFETILMCFLGSIFSFTLFGSSYEVALILLPFVLHCLFNVICFSKSTKDVKN